MRDDAPPGRAPRWHLALLAVPMALQAWAGLYAAVASSDTSRDVYLAQQIALGQSFPLTGPAINAVFHLGPLWFYLLAIPLLLVPSAATVTASMGLVSATQFPLAYALGRRLRSAEAGLLFALCLALPGWVVTAFGSLTHPILVIPSLLLGALVGLGYRRSPGPLPALGTGVVLALMCTAHPTLVLPGALLLLWCLHAAPRWRDRLWHACLMALPVLLSLAPMLYDRWVLDFDASAASVAAYTASEWSWPSPLGAVELVYAVLAYGPQYVTRYWLGLPPQQMWLLFAAYLALLALALAGLLLQLRDDAGARRLAAWIAGILLLHAMFVVAIRELMPPWMVYAHWVFVAALLALGLERLLRFRWTRLAIVLLVAINLAWTGSLYAWLNGSNEFRYIKPSEGRHGGMDVRDYEDREGGAYRIPRTRFLDLFSLGRPLCQPVTLYGHYAQQVDYTFAASAVHACGSTGQVRFGGVPGPGRAALLGLLPEAWQVLGLAPERWVGPMGTSAPQAILHSSNPLEPVVPQYSTFPRSIISRERSFTVQGTAPADAVLLVAHRGYRYLTFRVEAARADGRELAPRYADATAELFAAPSPAAGGVVQWQFEILGSPDYVDVLVFGSATAAAEPAAPAPPPPPGFTAPQSAPAPP